MGADAAAANYYYEGLAEVLETGVGEEDAVTGELFEDEVFIVVAQSCPSS